MKKVRSSQASISINSCAELRKTFFSVRVVKTLLRPGLHYAIYSTFNPNFMCWKYFDECFVDKSLLHTSLTKFNKLSKRRKRTFLITQFGGSFDLHLFTYNFFDAKSK